MTSVAHLPEGERRLAAIMFTDMVGYTALSQRNEALAMRLLEEHRKVVRPFFAKHNGREVKTIGDGFLVEFGSALEAVRCAFDIQQSVSEMNAGRQREERFELRIGVHVGDVIHSQNDIYGDAVNVSSRVEPLAAPGGICVSEQVYDQIRNKFEFPLTSLGRKDLKNVGEPVEVFSVVLPWERSKATVAASYPTNRIAILPFRNMSPDPADEYFAEGMTEELITSISGLKELTVIARTSVMKYKGGTKGVDEIGRELNVGTLVEGSVRKAGSRIRVTVQLIDSNTEGHLWAQNYDRNLDDIFSVQSDIAQRVAESMKVNLLEGERARVSKVPTQNMSAYESYLKGLSLMSRGGWANLMRAQKFLEDAVREDPDFPAAYAVLANFYVAAAGEFLSPREAFLKAEPLIARALELDDTSSDGHLAKGNLDMQFRLDYESAEREIKRAVELNPNSAAAHLWHGYFCQIVGNFEEALVEAKLAWELDPLSAHPLYLTVNCHFVRRDFRSAIETLNRVMELSLGDPADTHLSLANCHFWAGQKGEAEKELDAALQCRPGPSSEQFLALVLSELGRTTRARDLLREIEMESQHKYYSPTYLAGVHLALGERDRALQLVEEDFEVNPAALLFRHRYPVFDSIRSDPRFVVLVEKLHLPGTPDR